MPPSSIMRVIMMLLFRLKGRWHPMMYVPEHPADNRKLRSCKI